MKERDWSESLLSSQSLSFNLYAANAADEDCDSNPKHGSLCQPLEKTTLFSYTNHKANIRRTIMAETVSMKIIARIHSDFKEKFGIPRQSGLVEELESYIVFEPEYRNIDVLRGLEEFSHLWIIWQFSESVRENWSPTVRPPRLGGNERMGVFATRSPFRPNEIGLSSVKIRRIEKHKTLGPIIHVSGADLLDGTPIFDIKPYLPHVDSHPKAKGGFADQYKNYHLEVEIPRQWLEKIPEEKRAALKGVLENDPRPSYQEDPERIYGMNFAGYEIKFQVKKNQLCVCEIIAGEKK